MLVSYVVAHLYLDVLIIKLFNSTHCGIATELVEASGVHLVERSMDTMLIVRSIERHLVEGVIVVSRLLLTTHAFTLLPLDATNGGLGYLAPLTCIVVVLFVGYLFIHHTSSIWEC